jgi:hypothetical protein
MGCEKEFNRIDNLKEAPKEEWCLYRGRHTEEIDFDCVSITCSLDGAHTMEVVSHLSIFLITDMFVALKYDKSGPSLKIPTSYLCVRLVIPGVNR